MPVSKKLVPVVTPETPAAAPVKGKRAKATPAAAPVVAKVIPTKAPSAAPAVNANVGDSIESLLSQLQATTNANEKKKIRASLRRKGHHGGLRLRSIDQQRAASKEVGTDD